MRYGKKQLYNCKFVFMYTEEEQRFLDYWENNRKKSRNLFNGLAFGLPLGLILAITLVLNIASGWHKRATMIFNTDSSLILVLIIAIILIVVFISVFSVKHRWDMNEQRYRELISKKQK